jgi:hypothetical protein
MSLLIQLLNQTRVSNYLEVKRVTTSYSYKPSDPKEQQAIMDGYIPEPLRLLIHEIQMQKDLDIDNKQWIKDSKEPYIMFDIIEYLK